ncbi:unnamed protein product [Pseudo-nitzschia multistriata]|uniref:NAC-A/B domain-containing protein n=1 Tax=Pseudo-nitzschia multistriata TaxID=183589 RepID=A0A448ZAI2_9STRA|nr:unnamed protein product [Pseudo-nitzschia multistriata]
MGVKEELEALRSQGVTKKNASKLKDASGLSTPEAEENAIKAEQERTRIGNYKKDAEQNLQSYNEAKISVAKGGNPSIPASPSKGVPAPKKESAKATPAPVSAPVSAPAPAAAGGADAEEEVPTLEEVPDLEEMPSMDAASSAATQSVAVPPPAPAPINRAERKARRMMEKLGMKAVPGISQVVLKMRGGGVRGGIFTIASPDCYEKNGSYVIFGEARQGGGGLGGATQAQQQAQAIQQLAAMAKSDGSGIEMPAGAAAGGESPQVEKADTAVDETGLEAKDIDLCVAQAGCSRAKAVKALRENDGDLVNAIMSLTS